MTGRRLVILGIVALAAAVAFMTIGARGNWDFVLPFRGTKLLALVVVAVSVAVSTVIFQTLCGNRILTPSVMGFDSLYVLFQTSLLFLFGAAGYAAFPEELKFAVELGLLCGAALLLFGTLLGRGSEDLIRMLLVGVIFGILFRSLSSLLQRIIDPSETALVQGAVFASFNSVDTTLLAITTVLVAAAVAMAWRRRHRLDVMALGRDHAIGLGLNYRRELFTGLALVSALVATSTALVGPVVFFGLLVTALAHQIMNTHRHDAILIAASLIAIAVLVGGLTLFERVLGMAGTLSVARNSLADWYSSHWC